MPERQRTDWTERSRAEGTVEGRAEGTEEGRAGIWEQRMWWALPMSRGVDEKLNRWFDSLSHTELQSGTF